MCFSVHSSNCCSLAKRECWVSQDRVETLFRWGGKRLHFCTTNLSRTIYTKFYHNQSGFVDCISENILVFFRFTVYLLLSRILVIRCYCGEMLFLTCILFSKMQFIVDLHEKNNACLHKLCQHMLSYGDEYCYTNHLFDNIINSMYRHIAAYTDFAHFSLGIRTMNFLMSCLYTVTWVVYFCVAWVLALIIHRPIYVFVQLSFLSFLYKLISHINADHNKR